MRPTVIRRRRKARTVITLSEPSQLRHDTINATLHPTERWDRGQVDLPSRKATKRQLSATSAKHHSKVPIHKVGGGFTAIDWTAMGEHPRDVTQFETVYRLQRLKHSYDRIERRIKRAMAAGDVTRVVKLWAIQRDCVGQAEAIMAGSSLSFKPTE